MLRLCNRGAGSWHINQRRLHLAGCCLQDGVQRSSQTPSGCQGNSIQMTSMCQSFPACKATTGRTLWFARWPQMLQVGTAGCTRNVLVGGSFLMIAYAIGLQELEYHPVYLTNSMRAVLGLDLDLLRTPCLAVAWRLAAITMPAAGCALPLCGCGTSIVHTCNSIHAVPYLLASAAL